MELDLQTQRQVLAAMILGIEKERFQHITMGRVWHRIGNAVQEEASAKAAGEVSKVLCELQTELDELPTS